MAGKLETYLKEMLCDVPRIDRINVRAKGIDRFVAKAASLRGDVPKYQDPLHQIQDQIGARVIVFYKSDVGVVTSIINKYERGIEARDLVPETAWTFGYFGTHHVLFFPSELLDDTVDRATVPDFYELQIKTLFQHAWSEANHDLGHKPGEKALETDELRQLAFTSAQAWGADRVFDELHQVRVRGI